MEPINTSGGKPNLAGVAPIWLRLISQLYQSGKLSYSEICAVEIGDFDLDDLFYQPFVIVVSNTWDDNTCLKVETPTGPSVLPNSPLFKVVANKVVGHNFCLSKREAEHLGYELVSNETKVMDAVEFWSLIVKAGLEQKLIEFWNQPRHPQIDQDLWTEASGIRKAQIEFWIEKIKTVLELDPKFPY